MKVEGVLFALFIREALGIFARRLYGGAEYGRDFVRFLKERGIGCDPRVSEKLEAVFAFIRLLECNLELRLKFRA